MRVRSLFSPSLLPSLPQPRPQTWKGRKESACSISSRISLLE